MHMLWFGQEEEGAMTLGRWRCGQWEGLRQPRFTVCPGSGLLHQGGPSA